LIGGRDGDRECRPQERRTAGRLKMAEQVARLLGSCVAEIADALISVGLCANDLIGILNASARYPQGSRAGRT
jgi:hypothetical protein